MHFHAGVYVSVVSGMQPCRPGKLPWLLGVMGCKWMDCTRAAMVYVDVPVPLFDIRAVKPWLGVVSILHLRAASYADHVICRTRQTR